MLLLYISVFIFFAILLIWWLYFHVPTTYRVNTNVGVNYYSGVYLKNIDDKPFTLKNFMVVDGDGNDITKNAIVKEIDHAAKTERRVPIGDAHTKPLLIMFAAPVEKVKYVSFGTPYVERGVGLTVDVIESYKSANRYSATIVKPADFHKIRL